LVVEKGKESLGLIASLGRSHVPMAHVDSSVNVADFGLTKETILCAKLFISLGRPTLGMGRNQVTKSRTQSTQAM
ncbi:hypothetical protein BaRGS_00028473, partial [Batillaria attramentaria]